MKVAILSQYYKPEDAKIPNSLAQSLSERGHVVRVVTAFPRYPGNTIYEGYKLRIFHHEREEAYDDLVETRAVSLDYLGARTLTFVLSFR